MEILMLMAAIQRREAIEEELRRKYDARREAASRMREWMARELHDMEPAPGQYCDTLLGNWIGLPAIAKRSKMPSAALGIVDFETLGGGGWLVTAAGQVDGALKAALERLGGIVLTEMHNRGLGKAGEVRSVKVERGVARLIARIAPLAEGVVRKIRHRVLPFIEIIHDGAGNVLDCSLVDRPSASDEMISKRGAIVLAKLYERKEEEVKLKSLKKAKRLLRETDAMLANTRAVNKRAEPQFSASGARALLDVAEADAMRRDPRVDSQAALGRRMQAEQRIGPEFIKAVRANPANRRQVI
jgi:hypothetical protein